MHWDDMADGRASALVADEPQHITPYEPGLVHEFVRRTTLRAMMSIRSLRAPEELTPASMRKRKPAQ